MAFPIGLACAITSGKVILESVILMTVVVVSPTLHTFWAARRGHDSDSHMQEVHPNLPLHLFSSSLEIDSIPKLAPDRKYFSSGSSNPSVDRSPSSLPPVTQKLFPMPTLTEKTKPGNLRGNANVTSTRTTGCITYLQLFGGSTTGAENGSSQSSPYQPGYTSSSSLNSDAQIVGRFNKARAARPTLPHYVCQTPLFMPVSRQGQ